MKYPSIAEIKGMSQEDLDTLNRENTKKIAIQMATLLWLKITVPRIAAVCLKHAVIHAAKKL